MESGGKGKGVMETGRKERRNIGKKKDKKEKEKRKERKKEERQEESKKELKNCRPIALANTVGKIFCAVLNERLCEWIEREN